MGLFTSEGREGCGEYLRCRGAGGPVGPLQFVVRVAVIRGRKQQSCIGHSGYLHTVVARPGMDISRCDADGVTGIV